MKHGQGASNTRERPVPPRTRASAFQASHNTTNDLPRTTQKDVPRTTPKARSGWDNWPDPQAGVPPGMSRSNTMRVPKKSGFAPATPGGDEPMARNTSAYFSMPRTGRPQAPRAETQYPPPPPGPPPAAKHAESPTPDPFKSFRSPQSADDPFAHSDRLSTPYASMSGERTYFSSEGLNRSPTNRSNKGSGGFSSGFPSHVNSLLSPRMHGRHRSASPNIRSPMPQRPNSSGESSSDISSDEDISATGRRASTGHRTVPRRPTIPPRDRYRPTSSETDGPHSTSPHHNTHQFASHNPDANAETTPEGFSQHRMKREADKAAHPASPLHTNKPWNNPTAQRPLEKSKSWHDRYGWTEDINNQRKFDRPTSGESKENHPTYDFSNSNSFPPKFAQGEMTGIRESRKPKYLSGLWPPWAIPSSVVPKPKSMAEKIHVPSSPWSPLLNHFVQKANTTTPHSFNIGNSSVPAQPLRNPSSESINTNFSPSDWHGKFGDAEEFLGATGSGYTSGRASPPKGRASPPKARSRNQQRAYPKLPLPNEQAFGDSNSQMPPPPVPTPSPGKSSFSGEEWSQHFKESNWAFQPPPPPKSPRPGVQKRTLRKPSGTQQKRPIVPKPAAVTATIIDGKEEVEDTNSAVEIEGSPSSGDGSAMDIDLEPTPPGNQRDHQGPRRQSAVGTENSHASQQVHTSIPNTTNEMPNLDEESPHLNLNGLKDTVPLVSNKSGLTDLDDLSNTLPFESRSSSHPVESLAPQRLALPNPPKAPSVPHSVTQESWNFYVARMKSYTVEWNTFNRKMLAHFQTRQQDFENKLGKNWVSAIGEDGYARYMQGIEEDIRVREHWNISWEKHRACMKELGAVRKNVLVGKLHF